MYLRILKRDLKRKRTMNIILLMFIILASMFVSSSVNNIISVYNGLDYYFDKSGMADYFAATLDRGKHETVTDILDKIEEIDSYGIEHVIYMSSNIKKNGEELPYMKNTSALMSYEDTELTYFDQNNEPIPPVEDGTVWFSVKGFSKNGLEIGDVIEITIDGVSKEYTVAGCFKDALLGSEMMGMTRIIISRNDFECYDSDAYEGSLCYIKTDDISAVERMFNGDKLNILFVGGRDLIKLTYVMDMIIAGVLLVISILLILTAFVVLRFTIAFTLSEEFREIGVMKAIGIKNTKIRMLYMVKYFALSVIGSVIGFFAGVPFGSMLLGSVSSSIVLENKNNMLTNLICSAAVVGIILLFCFGCTRRVVKFTPLDAIRNGETGERFRKKSLIHLGKSGMKPFAFLALNDVVSNPRRYGIIAITFVLCLSPVMMLANTANTIKSGNLVTSFGITESDVYFSDVENQMSYMSDGGENELRNYLEMTEKKLAENGMPAECRNEVMFKLTLTHGEESCKSIVMKGFGTTADMYQYYEGTAPQNSGEVALTKYTAEKLGVTIGDTVTIRQLEGDKEYIITALFQSMNNQGEGVRLHESTEIDFIQAVGFFSFQINFKDNPDSEEIGHRIEKIKTLLNSDDVITKSEFIEQIIGVSDALDGVKMLVLVLAAIISALVTVLMERSFVEKERGEIAIMKAIGFKSGAVIARHTLRLGTAAVVSVVFAALISTPFTQLAITPIFNMMGAGYGIEYFINPLEIFVLYPLLMLAITLLFAFISAQYTREITAAEATNIE